MTPRPTVPELWPCVQRDKRPYPSAQKARRALREMQARLNREGQKDAAKALHAFPCSECGSWHLGKKRPVRPTDPLRAATERFLEGADLR